MNVGVVILAAGESARMGEPKQLLEHRGRTLLDHAIDVALSLRVVPVVVLGAHAGLIRDEIGDRPVIVAENPTWRDGMGASLRIGLRALVAAVPETSAAIFMLCDQPLVSAATLAALISAHQRNDHAIVASEYGGTLGVPALFARPMFVDLFALDATAGAQQVIQAHRERALGIPFPDGVVDIDTPADYSRLRELSTPAHV